MDVHVDLIDWRGERGFIGAAAALGALVGRLRAQRLSPNAAPEAIGILTHHAIMDDATAKFLDRLIALTARHAAIRWAAATELMQ